MNSKAEILEWLAEDPTQSRFVKASRLLEDLELNALPSLRVAILRNITIEPIVPYLKVQAYAGGLKPEVYLGAYDNAVDDVFAPASELFRFEPDIVAVAWRLHTLCPSLIYRFAALSPGEIDVQISQTLERVTGVVKGVRERTSALILVHNFERALFPVYGVLDAQWTQGQNAAIARLNSDLLRIVQSAGGFILDLDGILSRIGYAAGLDDRYWHIGHAPYSAAVLRELADQVVRFGAALNGKNRKCLVLDCDNTLWGGAVGEEGMAGIRLGDDYPGLAYREFQAAILDLYHRGIILAINSKNNEADALEVLQSHPGSLLRPEHFAARRINWHDKAQNLRELAGELNIGLDSMVFIDDSAAECALIRQALPDVYVIHLPSDPTGYRRRLQSCGLFDTLSLNDEDRRRNQMYRVEKERKSHQAAAGTLDDYLHSLGMRLHIADVDAYTVPRIAQLTQKTNQFNVTTRRYTEEEIRRLQDNPNTAVFTAALKDRFDDIGTVAAAIVRWQSDTAFIDTFLMSCRVIGRGIEHALMAHILDAARTRNCSQVIGEYLPTAKNALVKDLFETLGFKRTESGKWEARLSDTSVNAPPWFNAHETD